jgi:hypothetical protein
VGGFHVDDVVAFLAQFMGHQAGDLGQKLRFHPTAQAEAVGGFDGVEPLDPLVEHDVLAQDVDFDGGMPGDFGADFIFGTPRLPQLQPLAGDIDGQRELGPDSEPRWSEVALAELHQE